MPSTVRDVFRAASLEPVEVTAWGCPPKTSAAGVYVVSLARNADALDSIEHCPISAAAVDGLLALRPDLQVDGQRPAAAALASRLAALWHPPETVVYIGLAGTSLRRRVTDYYRTPLGARAPHAGGWPLKVLEILSQLSVHVAPCDDPDVAERAMVEAFLDAVDDRVAAAMPDPALPLPFGNLRHPAGRSQRHGITGARAPRESSVASPSPATPKPVPRTPDRVGCWTLNITQHDIDSGHVRVTQKPKSQLQLPEEPTQLSVRVRGVTLACHWNPRNGPDKSRSGLLRLGRQMMTDTWSAPTTAAIHRTSDGALILD
jgi:hypothetical protein